RRAAGWRRAKPPRTRRRAAPQSSSVADGISLRIPFDFLAQRAVGALHLGGIALRARVLGHAPREPGVDLRLPGEDARVLVLLALHCIFRAPELELRFGQLLRRVDSGDR